LLVAEAGQGMRPLTNAKAISNSFASSRRRNVVSRARCSVCADSVYSRLDSISVTTSSTIASSTRLKPALPARRWRARIS